MVSSHWITRSVQDGEPLLVMLVLLQPRQHPTWPLHQRQHHFGFAINLLMYRSGESVAIVLKHRNSQNKLTIEANTTTGGGNSSGDAAVVPTKSSEMGLCP